MKILQTGVVVARSNGVMSFGGWTVDDSGLNAVTELPNGAGFIVEGEFTQGEQEHLVAHAKEHGTYFESDILSLTDVMRLMKARQKHGQG